jgi:tripartite-type tricarboxylate transporter receptor subunit TctC
MLFTLLSAASSSAANQIIFAGKNYSCCGRLVGGGGYDLWARLMAQHIGKHIPGNPSVVVQNMPGPAAPWPPIISMASPSPMP